MFAIVESGSITSMPRGNKGVEINGVKHPASIFTLWSESERNAIGVYTVEMDNTNKKDSQWYDNTNITYTFSDGKVKGTYGTATAKNIADTLWTSKDKTDGLIPSGKDVGDVATEGLKTIKKRMIDNQCAQLLAPSDWMYIKAGEEGVSMDSGWKTWRASVRTKCNSMQTQIDNAADVDALAALFNYTEQGDGSSTRPLGEFPIKE
tara:strand:+ start:201 stop:818 length:618 start_codon:yes stop_codon:yes gene_type:complete